MAYLRQIPEEQQNQFGLQTPTTPQPAQSGGSTGGGTGVGATPGQASSTQFGSNAAKLSDYLKANEPQVKEFGNEVAGNLGKTYGQTKGSIDTGYGNFLNQVNQGWSQPNQEQINQAATNPVEYAKNPENVKQFQGWFNNSYSGPENFQGSDAYAGINRDVNKAVQDASMVGNQSGLESYLRNNMNQGNLTPGMQSLNSALLQKSPESRQAIEAAARPFSSLNEYLGGKAQEAGTAISGKKEQAQSEKEALRNKFVGEGGVLPTFKSGIASRQQEQAQRAINESNAMNNFASATNLSGVNSDDLGLLGLTRNQFSDPTATGKSFSDMYSYLRRPDSNSPRLNLNDYFSSTPNPGAITNESVSTPEEFAQAQALSQLTGESSYLNPEQSNLAGTAPYDTTFNYDKSLEDLIDIYRRFGPRPPDVGGGISGGNISGGYRAF